MGLGGTRGSGRPLENHYSTWFLSNTGPDPLENHKAPSQHHALAIIGHLNGVLMEGRL